MLCIECLLFVLAFFDEIEYVFFCFSISPDSWDHLEAPA